MKKHYIILGLFCLLAIVACSDNDPVVEVNNGNQTEEELPPLPTEVITGSRAMWVSYDPAPNVDANNSSGISSALISWRLLKTDPSNVAFDIYKSVDGETEVKLNEKPISNTTSWVDADIDVSKTNVYRVTLANQAETLCDYTFTSEMAEKYATRPLITMSMSKLGVISRLVGEAFGSSMTFGAVGQVSAPGQIPVEKLQTAMAIVHEAQK